MKAFCRDCFWSGGEAVRRCPTCASPRIVAHPELGELAIAHMDCDAFYASVEKRDNPELRDKPVIIGGGKRGVVSTACYIARIKGVRSAMPMFKALKACPEAVVIRPDFAKYRAESKRILGMAAQLTPLIQNLSLDEAWMDLSGTERLHGAPPALTLARLQTRIEDAMRVGQPAGIAETALAELDRGDRSATAWKDALATLLDRATGYRKAELSRDQLVLALESPATGPERRLAAAIALAAEGDAIKPRIEAAAQACANRKVRIALEAAARGELDDATIEAALEEEEESAAEARRLPALADRGDGAP